MSSQNLFIGNNEKEKFARESYRLLMKREWISYSDIMEIHTPKPKDEKWTPATCPVSKWTPYYDELKKAFPAVCKAIRRKCGEQSIEEDGNNRKRRYRYVGAEDNPLEEMLNAKVISDLKFYWQFCQDSAGFFPSVWLEDFFKDSFDLLNIKKKKQSGEQIISTSIDRTLTNIEYLPYFYKAITYEWVLKFSFQPFGEAPLELVFHPQHIKEFNGRWFVLGKAEGKDVPVFNVALDRITSKPRIVHGLQYQPAPKGFYKEYFDDIVGVTHKTDLLQDEIVIHTKSAYIHGLMVTKPIHHSQKEILPYGQYDDGEYGEITMDLRPNMEFIGKILTYGEGLEVIRPQSLREQIIEILKKQIHIYLSD